MRQLLKQSTLILGIFVITLSLIGCQTADLPKSIELSKENTLRFMIPGAPTVLDPGTSSETYSGPIIDHTFETLSFVDKSGQLQPGAAERWKISDDGKVYTFYLRKEAKWSDSKTVTANDFKNAWLRVLNPDTKSNNASLFTPYILNAAKYNKGEINADSVGIKALDDFTLEVQLEAPTSFFLQLISFWSFSPVRTDIVEKAGNGWDMSVESFISNGAYKVKSIEKGKSVLMVKNPYYWNAKAIKIEGIEILFKQEGQAAYELYKNGEIDGVYEVLVSDLRTISDLETELYIHQAMSTAFIFLNHDNSLLAQQSFREALGLTIDRQKLVDEVLLGGGIASRFLVPSSMSLAGENFHEFTELNPPPNDTKAKALMEKTDFSKIDKSKPIRVYYLNGRKDGEVMTSVIEKWQALFGLKFEIKGMEWTDLYNVSLKGDYDIVLMGFGGDYPHPMTFIGTFLESGFGNEISNWNDKSFQDEVYKALAIQDQKASLSAYRALESRIIDEYHILPIYHRKLICLVNDRVSGWYRDGLLHFNFKEAELIN